MAKSVVDFLHYPLSPLNAASMSLSVLGSLADSRTDRQRFSCGGQRLGYRAAQSQQEAPITECSSHRE